MAIFRQEDIPLDSKCTNVQRLTVGLKDPRAIIERAYTYRDAVTSPTPRIVIRDSGRPDVKFNGLNGGPVWPHVATLICVRVKEMVDIELPDDCGRFLGIVTEPTASWYVCVARDKRKQAARADAETAAAQHRYRESS